MLILRNALTCSTAALAMAAALMPGVAAAQQAPGGTNGPADQAPADEIVVTGTYIRGAAETGAIPVNVITAESMAKQGSPSTVEMLKALPAASGIIGESNQFIAGRGASNEGQASVNLRGLGPERTLVLLDGKRFPTFTNFVDVNTFPAAAIARVEVLKDGAAATYGSDAVAGVVNFITRDRFDGLELNADYRYITGSDGDLSGSVLWGKRGERTSLMLSAGFQYKSDLPVLARDWAVLPFESNPQGGWSAAANPGRFIPLNGSTQLGAALPDPGCAALGEVLTNPTPGGFTVCRAHYTVWDNLVDKQVRAQFYGKLKTELSDRVTLTIDGLYSFTDAPSPNRTPSFAVSREVPASALPAGFGGLNTSVTPATLGGYYIPSTNPGYQAIVAAYPNYFPWGTNGALIPLGAFRPFLSGGNPLFDYGPNYTPQYRSVFRTTAELSGTLGDSSLARDLAWNLGVTYGRYASKVTFRDTLTVRLQAALRGLGGPNCNYATGTPGVGSCSYFNPFSNALPGSPPLGLTNPGYVPALANNNKELVDWMFPQMQYQFVTKIMNIDAGLSGTAPIELPGGPIRWAVGGQVRTNSYSTEYGSFTNALLYPCADTPLNGNTNCFPKPTSPLVVESQGTPVSLSQTIYAVFGELNIPVFDTFNISAAARFEDYGAKGGSTFNPQLRAKFQAFPWFALRGSVGTTFRAPPQESVAPVSSLAGLVVFGQTLPVETKGNPNLGPEKATSYSVGGIFEVGRLRASVDYWNYQLKDILTAEPLANVLAAAFPAGGGTCNGDPAFIASHFAFSSGCSSSTITRVTVTQINGPRIKTSGFDFILDYSIPDVLAGGTVNLGASATYVDKYSVGQLVIGGVPVAGSAFEAAGNANILTVAYPLPKWKGQGFVEYAQGNHNLRLTGRYTGAYTDQRGLFTYSAAQQTGTVAACGGTPPTVVSPTCGTVTAGQRISAAMLFDLTYRVKLPWYTTATLSVNNLFDRDPPFSRQDLNYDAMTGDPLGRTIKLSLQKSF
ncbi:TonB-dependent receptor [Novosphingobium flavum]|uniref:TonB-dependent receptor n=1 Tax=Novosphingobium flavum TaxID=1778672 RepID=A0A7X1FNW1_9SPHN|nr:TonB-dependent receptor [Novosphingobium flavum]MBC2664294.1 TonB-dependent receptor [Novosphingobium flavum]